MVDTFLKLVRIGFPKIAIRGCYQQKNASLRTGCRFPRRLWKSSARHDLADFWEMGMQNIGKNVDLVKLVQAAYQLSMPQGLGFLHYQAGGLTDDEAKAFIKDGRTPVYLDYVKGRSCKLSVSRDEDGMLYVGDKWYDHDSFDPLFKAMGITPESRPEEKMSA
jgi:hypothetical protein